MSVSSEVARLNALKVRLRTVCTRIGVVTDADASLSDIVTAMETYFASDSSVIYDSNGNPVLATNSNS